MDEPARRPCRVLVVEDDEDQQLLVRTILSDEGFDVEVAGSGREGLKLLADWHPDVLLLDLMLSDMAGQRFRAEQLRLGIATHAPLIVMSATFAADLDRKAAELGAVLALPKPFDVDALAEQIRRRCPG